VKFGDVYPRTMSLIINGFYKNPHSDSRTFHRGKQGFLIVFSTFSPHLYKGQFNTVCCGQLRQTLVCETKNEFRVCGSVHLQSLK